MRPTVYVGVLSCQGAGRVSRNIDIIQLLIYYGNYLRGCVLLTEMIHRRERID